MTTDVDQICYGWSCEELDDQDDSRDISVSQMLDHRSISFGRFALEPLSWEKRSVFTHNRYQEELEKLKAPGLVAQKKAYFEEYYKRIRAMKALQENKHSESASNCGDSSGISGHITEDERVVPIKSDGDEMISTRGPGVEKASTELTLDVDGETALAKLDSPATFSKDNKYGESPPNSKHWQILDINYHHDVPITTSIADSGQHDFIRVDNKLEPRGIISESISRRIGVENQRIIGEKSYGDELEHIIGSDREKASIEVSLGINVETALLQTDPPVKSYEDNKMGENSQNKQFQFLDQNSCDNEPITTSIEDRKQHEFISQDNQGISNKMERFLPNDYFYSSSSPKVLEDKLNAEQKKVNQAVKEFKGNAFSSEVMEHSSTAGDLVKSELKTKSVTVTLTHVLRDSSQKRNGNNVCIVSHKQTVDRILSSKHATAASDVSNKEMHSKLTTPRPFDFATGKQAVASVSASARYDTKNILSSSSLPPKNIGSKGVSSRTGIPYSQKREKLENRRGHEPRGQPIVTNRQATHFKGVGATNVIRTLEARSVNLSTSCKGDSNVGTNSNRITRNHEDGKRKLMEVANDETCLKEVRTHGKSTIFHVLSGNQNPDNIKMAPSRTRDLSVNTKISHPGDNSLDSKKSRPEKPRWR